MGIWRSPTYWNWPMSTTHFNETCTDQILGQEKNWKFFQKGILKKTCSACVCMTWQHFCYSSDKHCGTILLCHVHRRLILLGDPWISSFLLCLLQREKEIGWCPEVARHLNRSICLLVFQSYLWSTYEVYWLYWLALFLYWFLAFLSPTSYGFRFGFKVMIR